MILAEKISTLRKKNGWSQEELAEKMNVSRQSVSKWEGAQSIPDLEKILQLGQLFGVTTDYLLKDEIEDEEYTPTVDTVEKVRRVSLEDANTYLNLREQASKKIALATFLCILSPICLLFLPGYAEFYQFSPEMWVFCGLIILFILVAIAVMIFISCGSASAEYEFLEKEPFDTEYGVVGMVKERQKAYKDTYTRSNLVGVCICILSPIPLFVGAFSGNELFCIAMLCVTMLLVGVGVVFFITAGVKWESMQKLLQEGDYTPAKKTSLSGKIASAYWPIIVAVYLAWSFITNDWHITWVIWPIAGAVFAGISSLCNSLAKKK